MDDNVNNKLGPNEIVQSWHGLFKFKKGSEGQKGLRSPQIGALRIPVDTRSPIPVISVQSVADLQYRWQS